MSSSQRSVIPSTTMTVTVVLLAMVAVALLLQLKTISLELAFPFFLIPVGTYVAVLGFGTRRELHKTQDHGYYFTWAGIMLAVGIGWIVLHEGWGVIIGTITMLSIALGFVYLHRIKSSSGAVKTSPMPQ